MVAWGGFGALKLQKQKHIYSQAMQTVLILFVIVIVLVSFEINPVS